MIVLCKRTGRPRAYVPVGVRPWQHEEMVGGMIRRRGQVAWAVGLVVFVALVLMLPTSSTTACFDPGGCVNYGSDAWTGLVRWPFSSSAAVDAYWLATLALGVLLAITGIRHLRH
jgi:hypothetical protein